MTNNRIKIFVLISAVIIALVTVFYTNHIARNIEKEEEQKVKLWAEAIQKKATLIRFTKELFMRLSTDERTKVKNWSKASNLVLKVDDNDVLTFLLDVISANESIPVIYVDENLNIKNTRNIDANKIPASKKLEGALLKEFSVYPPIMAEYYDEAKQKKLVDYIYYKDSKTFSELKVFLDEFLASFLSEIITNSSALTVIMVDKNENILAAGNIDSTRISKNNIHEYLEEIATYHEPISVDLGGGVQNKIYYKSNPVISQLRYFPIVQLGLIFGLLLVAYLAIRSSRKSEQNQVWAGMAKETAHQLGTPISSLSAWVEYMKEKEDKTPMDEKLLTEIEKDVNRLTLIADRFSKIGSQPKLKEENVQEVLERAIQYVTDRASKKIQVKLDIESPELSFRINKPLFDWVVENVLKNALDAMEATGNIWVRAFQEKDDVIIEIKDTGKGMVPALHKKIFEPGFTTKQRGWGLGLSLCKRIVEEYFQGKIFVKYSEIGKGTTFRIEIPV